MNTTDELPDCAIGLEPSKLWVIRLWLGQTWVLHSDKGMVICFDDKEQAYQLRLKLFDQFQHMYPGFSWAEVVTYADLEQIRTFLGV